MESLGMMSYRRFMKINEDSLNLSSYLGDGLRYLTDSQFTSVLVQVGTLTYNKSARKYLWGAFNVLVMFGVGVVAWFMLEHYPVGFEPFPINPVLYPTDVFNTFKNPNTPARLEWGERLVYLTLHDDLVNRVLSIYRNQPPFCDILPQSEFVLETVDQQQRYAAVGTAIIIASYIAANLVTPGGIAA